MSTELKRGDWVTTKRNPHGAAGTVQRVARDGSWADVRWHAGRESWTKRMQSEHLIVRTTIKVGGGLSVTDVQRERELCLRGVEADAIVIDEIAAGGDA